MDEERKSTQNKTTRKIILPILGLVLAFGLFVSARNIGQKDHSAPRSKVRDVGRSVQRTEESTPIVFFYLKEISPLIDDCEKRNHEASERAINAIHEDFAEYQNRIPEFVGDIVSWRTRFAIGFLEARDLWDNYRSKNGHSERAKAYVDEKFSTEVVSDKRLKRDLEDIISQFESDLATNRNRLFSEIRLALSTSDAPIVLHDKSARRFLADVNARASRVANDMTRDSVVYGLANFGASTVAMVAAGKLVEIILPQVIFPEAAAAMVTSGAEVEGVVGGGAAGSEGGPVGSLVGAGAGLVAGIAVDEWGRHKLESKLRTQCANLLARMETRIIKGTEKSQGLESLLDEAVKINSRAQRTAVLDALEEANR